MARLLKAPTVVACAVLRDIANKLRVVRGKPLPEGVVAAKKFAYAPYSVLRFLVRSLTVGGDHADGKANVNVLVLGVAKLFAAAVGKVRLCQAQDARYGLVFCGRAWDHGKLRSCSGQA